MEQPTKETIARISIGEHRKKIQGNPGQADWYLIDNQIIGEKDGKVVDFHKYRDEAEATEAMDYILDGRRKS
jgi:hypothetical protein